MDQENLRPVHDLALVDVCASSFLKCFGAVGWVIRMESSCSNWGHGLVDVAAER